MSNQNNQTLKDITDYIETYGFGNKSMGEQSRLEEDLGITGTDAMEFLVDFSKKFKVDMSNFMADDYFEDEGLPLFYRRITGRKKIGKKVLTLGHLIKAIKAGKLDEEVING